MKNKRMWWTLTGGLAGATLLATGVAVVMAQGKRPQPAVKIPLAAYATKSVIETPTERLVAGAAAVEGNPKVAAGKVRWHKDLATASASAAKSGKPVLVFHLMGKLDDRFC